VSDLTTLVKVVRGEGESWITVTRRGVARTSARTARAAGARLVADRDDQGSTTDAPGLGQRHPARLRASQPIASAGSTRGPDAASVE
jgi:hypothetical protein